MNQDCCFLKVPRTFFSLELGPENRLPNLEVDGERRAVKNSMDVTPSVITIVVGGRVIIDRLCHLIYLSRAAAVDRQDGSSNRTSLRLEQIRDGPRHMFRMRQPERRPPSQGLKLLTWQPRHHFGFHIAGRDAIHGNVPLARLARKRTREPFKPRFGRGVH